MPKACDPEFIARIVELYGNDPAARAGFLRGALLSSDPNWQWDFFIMMKALSDTKRPGSDAKYTELEEEFKECFGRKERDVRTALNPEGHSIAAYIAMTNHTSLFQHFCNPGTRNFVEEDFTPNVIKDAAGNNLLMLNLSNIEYPAEEADLVIAKFLARYPAVRLYGNAEDLSPIALCRNTIATQEDLGGQHFVNFCTSSVKISPSYITQAVTAQSMLQQENRKPNHFNIQH